MRSARVGQRWSVRHRLADGSATDVVGWVAAVEGGSVTMERSGADLVGRDRATVRLDDVIAARRLPPAAGGPDPMRIATADLQRLALPSWVADQEPLGEWVLRSAAGFSRRANSCLAVGDPGMPIFDAARRVESYADEHEVAPRAAVIAGSRADHELRGLGWSDVPGGSDLLVARLSTMIADRTAQAQVELSDTPEPGWLAAFGLSRPVTAPIALVRRILCPAPPLAFAGLPELGHADDGPTPLIAIARGHLNRDPLGVPWLGLSCVWTHPDHRHQGSATRLAVALGHWAARLGARNVYLQVESDATAALPLYQNLGLHLHHRSHLLAPPAPIPSAPIPSALS